MDQIPEFIDERQKSCCIHCTGWIAKLECNRDHVPTKSFLRKPYPANLPVVEVCASCNEGFSYDEQYTVAFLGAVLSGSTDPALQTNPTITKIPTDNSKLRERIERSKKEYRTRGGDTRFVWVPESERVNRVIVKNARGHAFFEYGEPMMEKPQHVWSAPLECLTSRQAAEFKNVDIGSAWPEVGSRMMARVMTGQDLFDGWVAVQEGIYRYAVAQQGGMLVRSVLWGYLATEVYWAD